MPEKNFMNKNVKKVEGEKDLYRHTKTRVYFQRIQSGGIDTGRSLNTTLIKHARERRDKNLQDQSDIKRGIKPAVKVTRLRVTTALNIYERAAFPSKRHGTLHYPGVKAIRTETDAVQTLSEFFKTTFVDELDEDLLDDYHEYRVEGVKEGADGDRTTDLELNTLSKSLDWAVRKKKLKVNPIRHDRMRYYNKDNAKHCKDFAAETPEELHAVAGHLFSYPEGEVLAWQFLFQSNFGPRTEETLKLRRDGKSITDPGFIVGDEMHVRRALKNTLNTTIYLHPQGKILMAAFDAWAEMRHPKSKVYFPSPIEGTEVVAKGSMNAALRRLFEAGLTPRRLRGHGTRAYYVRVERSHGVQDATIAIRLNQVAGPETLQRCYGAVDERWLNGHGPKLKYLPADPTKYAWVPLFTLLGIKVGDVVPAPTV
jgi:hypothetical protein